MPYGAYSTTVRSGFLVDCQPPVRHETKILLIFTLRPRVTDYRSTSNGGVRRLETRIKLCGATFALFILTATKLEKLIARETIYTFKGFFTFLVQNIIAKTRKRDNLNVFDGTCTDNSWNIWVIILDSRQQYSPVNITSFAWSVFEKYYQVDSGIQWLVSKVLFLALRANLKEMGGALRRKNNFNWM